MAKIEISTLIPLVRAHIDAELIAIGKEDYDELVPRNVLSDLTVKIAKQVMNDSEFVDRLPEFEMGELPYGTTIEEYFIETTMPVAHDADGTTTLAPKRPEFNDPYYSLELDRKTVQTTIDDNAYNNGMLGVAELSALVAKILKRLYDSQTIYKYWLKKQLLGEMIKRVGNTASLRTELALPSDAATGELFIKQVKEKVTELKTFITEDNNIAGVLATAPSLTMLVKGPKLLASLDVDTLAGAFNVGKVQIPVNVKAVEDFGDIEGVNKDTWAVLLDPRGIGVYTHNPAAKHQENAQGEFTNYFLHFTPVGYLSHYTNIHIWTLPE